MDEASRYQIAAADPLRSTWLKANAGSGKTRVLTDRVARLLLAGTPPERILCLTYTKAAATEMQNRLLARLGEWAMMPEPQLREALAALGETGTPDLAQARRLFARAIETPGGLKVQTIHSFCAAILRRFPLEAGVPIGFAELDDRSATLMRAEIIEELAEAGNPVIADLTALHSGHELDRFLASLSHGDFRNPPDEDAIRAALGLPAGMDEGALLAQVFGAGTRDLFGALIPAMMHSGVNDQKLADKLARGDWAEPTLQDLLLLTETLLTGAKAKEPFSAKIGSIPAKALQAGACAPLMDDLNDLMLRVQDARADALALIALRGAMALGRFGHVFTRLYADRKAAHGWLDFDDLIARTADLLSRSDMAQWVLWRLDGGIDHILVDEAQDTSPGQWQVIRALTAEFTSGHGARPSDRTLFVVGDPKQSIYSFQGADIAVFEAMRSRFAEDFALVQAPMQQRELKHSFRSSPAILRLVDAVFRGDGARGLGAAPDHLAHHGALPGRVDIWPPVPKPDDVAPGPWWMPVDEPAPGDAVATLATALAQQIGAMLGTPFYDIRARRVRPIDPGDILILVQRRSDLFHAIIGACKAADLPVAGADRLKLTAELAVRDIRALLDFIATPEDDLSLAAALRSPLIGLSEDDLYRLAAGRRGFLWETLRESGHTKVVTMLQDLRAQADFLRPYDLIARLLFRHRGRARLLARLGPEAEDGIAELVSQALAYETVETPSLTGFLVWLSGGEVEVKRQASGSGGLIRVMTVHGAKGLESPVVILPDTAKRQAPRGDPTIALDGLPVPSGSKATRPAPLDQAVADKSDRTEDERRRLLYVGLTRAESWLIVAAAGDTGDADESWHAMVAGVDAGAAGLTESAIDIPGIGTGRRLSFGDWPALAKPQDDGTRGGALPPLPDWADTVPPRMARPPAPVTATSLGGAKIMALSSDGVLATVPDDAESAQLRGTRLHLLLELLPGAPPDDWPDIARDALAGAEGGLPTDADLDYLLTEAEAVITAPELAAVMAPEPDQTVLREVPLTASLGGLGTFHGIIDRLLIGEGRVLIVDFKSNRDVPDDPALTPEGILRQLAAYRHALRSIYPGRRVDAAVLWTRTRQLMDLPAALLDDAAGRLGLAADPDDRSTAAP